MSQYQFLAERYDALTQDVDYQAIAAYTQWQFSRKRGGVKLALDLCCGTGSLTHLLAEQGIEMIGVDASPEMLSEAAAKQSQATVPPFFLSQSIERLDLYGSVDACVSTQDSINYIIEKGSLQKGFERVHLFLEPGGLFLFDVNRPETLRAMDGEVYLDETEDTYCVWRGSMQEDILCFDMDLFRRQDKLWQRAYEQHLQRAYDLAELEGMLRQAGFQTIELFGNLSKQAASAADSRVFFAAWKDEVWKPEAIR